MKSAVALGILGFGIALLVLGTMWGQLFSGSTQWTDEKAKRSAEVKVRLVQLGVIVNSTKPTMHGGMDPASAKVEFDALQKENEQLNDEFESAANSPKKTSKFLRWTGVGLALVGLFGFYAAKQS
jgi:hypothetical protein